MFALKRQFAGWAFEVMDMGGSGGNFAGTCATKGFGSILRQAQFILWSAVGLFLQRVMLVRSLMLAGGWSRRTLLLARSERRGAG
jgi:hypothetical protein